MASHGETITEQVRSRYALAARAVQSGSGCCGEGCCGGRSDDAVTRDLYATELTDTLPEGAVRASLGCGNPTALIGLRSGETVLDLGSGGGIDVLLSAQRVGPDGFVYGVDMTEEMLALAERNRAAAGVRNVAFLKGRIEDIPLAANSVDVVISNCVINLAADKSRVLNDAFRVLRPGGRFAVADVVAEGPVPEALRETMEAWVGCIAGALEVDVYRDLLERAGFEDISIEVTRRYRLADAGIDTASLPDGWEQADGTIVSAFARATKPRTADAPAGHGSPRTGDLGCGCDAGCCLP